jgi:cytochrome P450
MTTSYAEVPDILSPEHDLDPQIAYRHLRENAPVFFHEGSDSWLISRHADILRLVRGQEVTSKNYSDGLGLIFGSTVLEMDGSEHQKHRLLLNPIFHQNEISRMRPEIRQVIESLFLPLVDAAAEPARSGAKEFAELDLVPAYFGELPIGIIEMMLNLPKHEHENFSRWYKAMMAFTANIAREQGPIDRGMKAREEMSACVLPLITERRNDPAPDLISQMALARLKDGESLTDEEVRAFVSLMITAGGETTDRALGQVMLNLLQHPDQLAAVRENRELVHDAHVETLRYSPPVNIAGRQAAVDIELHGQTIPAGATILCLIGAGNRDPRKFSEPDKFDIFRTDNSTEKGFTGAADHLGFLNGRHHCVGAQLAKAEIEMGVNIILDNMLNLRLAEGFVPRPEGLWTRGVDHLKVSFTPA